MTGRQLIAMHNRVAQCEECGSRQQLQVWYGDDGYGWPFGHTLRCKACPLKDVWKDIVCDYDALQHDKIFGLSDWDVPFQWILNTGQQALCFTCECAFDPEQAHGGEYLPEVLWDRRAGNIHLHFCRECYITRRRSHTDIQLELQNELCSTVLKTAIATYFARAPRGLLPLKKTG